MVMAQFNYTNLSTFYILKDNVSEITISYQKI